MNNKHLFLKYNIFPPLFKGDGWFQRLEDDIPQVLIPSIKHANNYHTAYMDLGIWTFQRDCYLCNANQGETEMESPRNIFIVEKSEVSIFSQGGHRSIVMASLHEMVFVIFILIFTNLISLTLVNLIIQMLYNAMGEILIPFVASRGPVADQLYQDFRHRLVFMETVDGDLNLNSLCLLGLFLEKYYFHHYFPFIVLKLILLLFLGT